MIVTRAVRWLLRIGTGLTLAFLYSPLVIIAIYAFNSTRVQTWPPKSLTFSWFSKALHNTGAADALVTSLKVGCAAMALALVLGSLAAYAISRFEFFGRESISFLLVLPIALPGIVTGMALNASFTQVLGVGLSLFTVIVGHATFCVVVVFNNVAARLRRTPVSFEEAAADLGATGPRAFVDITFPQMRSALIAGALLAFALSFDEVIVTTFTIGGEQTLPIWILNNLSRPRNLPEVNVVALVVIVLSIIPVWIAQRLSSDPLAPGDILREKTIGPAD